MSEMYTEQPKRSVEPDPEVKDAPNKAIAAFLTVLVGMFVQWAATQGFDIEAEGIVGALSVVVSAIVYRVSNRVS